MSGFRGNSFSVPRAIRRAAPLIEEAPPSESRPFSDIWSIEDLDRVRLNPSASYTLRRTLDFREDWSYDDPTQKANYTTGLGWLPIDGFSGVFDGAGHVIANLYVARTGHAGLFGFSNAAPARIMDLGLINPDVTSLDNNYAGALYAEYQQQAVVGAGRFERCFSIGGQATGGYAGGLFGRVYPRTSSAREAYIEDCYSTTTANGATGSGGIVGYLYANNSARAYLYRCLAAGPVLRGATYAGGLVGYRRRANSGLIHQIGSRWDFQTTGRTVDGAGSSWTANTDMAGMATVQLVGVSARESMPSFDFSQVWQTVAASQDDATGDAYPVLRTAVRERQLEANEVSVIPVDALLQEQIPNPHFSPGRWGVADVFEAKSAEAWPEEGTTETGLIPD